MTKPELIAKISEKAGITKVNAERGLEALLDVIEGALANDKKVALTGFGSFSVVERKERLGRNPKTGAEIKIPATRAVKFTVGKALKDAVQ
jgi:DNA-binding protein HU-beta